MTKSLVRSVATTALVATLALGGAGFTQLHLANNFGVVVEGEAYRSAQPSGPELAHYIERYKIATVINLRGGREGDPQHEEQVAITEAAGATHVTFGMSARKMLSAEETNRLIEIMRTAKKPLLIHCRSGADRTGLAAALYMAAVTGAESEVAEDQLSIRYGHIAVPHVGAYAMDETFERFKAVRDSPAGDRRL